MKASARVVFVVPYLGELPAWSRLFFQSVAANPFVDVLLLCEAKPSRFLPSNVISIQVTRRALIHRLRAATGLELNEISGHKLCDFRPFFGIAFADLLKAYEFWGFCDVDMMFGDLAKLLTLEFLQKTDVFSAHNSQIVGHFAIFRNTDLVNRAGFGIKNWREICLYPVNRALDELPFSEALLSVPGIRWERPATLALELKARFCRFGITFGFDGEVAYLDAQPAALVEWKSGHVVYSDASGVSAEVLYLHFMGLKRWWHWFLFRDRIESHNVHHFSRIGYGGPADVTALVQAPWRYIFAIQRFMHQIKTDFGAALRRILPLKTYLRLRRFLFGTGRY